MSIHSPEIKALTFDCYGTLIDWESGIIGALAPLLRRGSDREVQDAAILESYARAEACKESGEYRRYREVLAGVTRDVAAEFGVKLQPGDESALAESVRHWPAFSDTRDSLSLLAMRFRLVILSNIDRDLFALTRPHLGPAPLELICAEDVRAYKPRPDHFQEALRRLNLAPAQVCHVAQSLFHDVPTARSLGFRTVWVNRRHDKPGSGATPPATATPDLEVPDLASLAAVAVPSSS